MNMETHEKVEGFRREQVRAGETRRVRETNGRMVMRCSAACNGGNCDLLLKQFSCLFLSGQTRREQLVVCCSPWPCLVSVKVTSTLCLAYPE